MGSTCSKNDDDNSGNDKSEIEDVDDENMPLNEMTKPDDEENDEDEASNNKNENE